MQDDNKYIDIEFYRLWKYVRISRQTKEAIKTLLFSGAPSLFNSFASFQHWKNSKIFAMKADQTPEKRSGKSLNIEIDAGKSFRFAVVLHVFYIDVFKQILSMLLANKATDFKLFITCPASLKYEVESVLTKEELSFNVLTIENQGRDILPFLKILPKAIEQGYDTFLKIHTKRSNHLNKYDLWGTELFGKLLGANNMQNALQIFSSYPKVGMIGPAGHILPMSLYYGGNAVKVKNLCTKMGLDQKQLQGLNFVAGSMFYASKDVLLPILKLNLSDNDFENEDKQLDNTMAHAVERTFAAGLLVVDKKLADTSSTPDNISCQITMNHPFTI